MKTAIAVFVKTPDLSPIKTRLAENIGDEKACDFYLLSLHATAETLKTTDLHTYWAVAEEDGLHGPLWQEFKALYTGPGDLGARQHHIYAHLLGSYDQVLLIGADTPQLSTDHIDAAIDALKTHDFVIGPARDGGYYLFGGKVPMDSSLWAAIPWGTSETCETLESHLPASPPHIDMLTDVDTVHDLPRSVAEMPDAPSASQQKLIDWIKSLGN